MSHLERAALGPPLGRAGDLEPGDAIDLGGIPHVVVDVVPGPRAEPGDPRTLWLRFEHGGPARPMLEDDPVRMLTDLGSRAVWTERRRAEERDDRRHELPNLHRDVGTAVLAAWPRIADVRAGRAVVYLALVTSTTLAAGPVPAEAVARLTRLDGSTVRYHLRDLIADGLVEGTYDPERRGRAHRYRPSAVDVQSEAV